MEEEAREGPKSWRGRRMGSEETGEEGKTSGE